VRTYFDHETLDVYQLELQFITWVTPLLANVKQQLTGVRIAEVLDQLDRLLLRVTSIITKLIQRFDLSVSSSSSFSIVREEDDEQVFEDEEEDEKNE